MISIDNQVWFCGSVFSRAHVHACLCIRAHTYITRARGTEPENRARFPNDYNVLMVLAGFSTGSRQNRFPGPASGMPLASQIGSSPTGRGARANAKAPPGARVGDRGAADQSSGAAALRGALKRAPGARSRACCGRIFYILTWRFPASLQACQSHHAGSSSSAQRASAGISPRSIATSSGTSVAVRLSRPNLTLTPSIAAGV